MYNSTLSLTSALVGVGGKHHSLAVLPPGKNWYPLYRRLDGPQGRSGKVQKISPQPQFDPQTVQPVASHYTHCAILAYNFGCSTSDKFESVEQMFYSRPIMLKWTWMQRKKVTT